MASIYHADEIEVSEIHVSNMIIGDYRVKRFAQIVMKGKIKSSFVHHLKFSCLWFNL